MQIIARIYFVNISCEMPSVIVGRFVQKLL